MTEKPISTSPNAAKRALQTSQVQEEVNPYREVVEEEEVEQTFFSYIHQNNVYHVAHVLKKILLAKPENLKYVCLVVASIDPEIAEKLLEEFPDELKATIVTEIMSLIQYSKKEIEQFDKIIRKLLTEQFGGKFVLSKILENLDLDQKMTLSSTFKTKYPENEKEFRRIMILFEDLFNLEDKDFLRIFSDIPSEVLSTAFCNQPDDQINRLYDILPKGIKSIVQQGIELGRKKYSKSDINKAQQYIIEFSRKLETDGFIGHILQEEEQKET